MSGIVITDEMVEAFVDATRVEGWRATEDATYYRSQARSGLEAALALVPHPPEGGMEAGDNLKERCREILNWQKTGILEGEAVRALADEIRAKHGQVFSQSEAISHAEKQTAKDAMQFVLAALTAPVRAAEVKVVVLTKAQAALYERIKTEGALLMRQLSSQENGVAGRLKEKGLLALDGAITSNIYGGSTLNDFTWVLAEHMATPALSLSPGSGEKDRIAELERALEPFANGSLDVSGAAIIVGYQDAKIALAGARAALTKEER